MDTVFIDESKTRGYTVVAAIVPSRDSQKLRREIAKLRKNGQARVHMVKESDPRRRYILSTLCRLGIRVRVYHATGLRNPVARDRCLRAIAHDALRDGHQSIVLERDDSIERLDRLTLRQAFTHDGRVTVGYRHDSASSEALLWIPDAVAWAFVRGGEWRFRIVSMILDLTDLSD